MIVLIVGTSEVKSLKSVLAQAKKEVEVRRMAADKVAKEAEAERTACLKHEARLGEVQQELKDAITTCESLEQKTSDQASELAKALQSMQEAQVEAQGACREIQEARQIAAGKAFLL